MQILKVRVRVDAGDGSSAEVEAEIHGASGAADAEDAVRDDQAAEVDQLRPRREGPPERPAGGGERAPETGRELIAWAGDHDMKPRVYQLGKAWKFPAIVLDWQRDDVLAVYHELLNERAKQPPRNGRRNGYAGARS